MVAEGIALAVAALAALAEFIHARRIRRVAFLAFGPTGRPSAWTRLAAPLHVLALTAATWGLVTLLLLPPQVFRSQQERPPGEQHLVVLLDVSPSMLLKDAGPTGKQSRRQRAGDLLRSFFRRVDIDQYKVTLIAVYNGAMPVVVDTRDPDVVDNILDDLPMHFAFDPGKTKLLEGLKLAAETARPWKPRSTIVLLLSDGDTVPSTGMPRMPVSVRATLVVGVGDTRKGAYIDGTLSRQDQSTLRQIAIRLGGEYHNGNEKHIPSDLVLQVAQGGGKSERRPWKRREYALLAVALGSVILAGLPLILAWAGATPCRRIGPVRSEMPTPSQRPARKAELPVAVEPNVVS